MNKILIIIPTYNEEENIIGLIDEIFSLNLGADVLVVDDGNDNAGNLIKEKQKSRANLFLIKRAGKGGRGSAVLEGMQFGLDKGVYEIFVEMDADFSHQTKELAGLVAAAEENCTVIASRYAKGSRIDNWPAGRRIFSRISNFYADFVLGIGLHDYTNGFRAYHKTAISKLDFEKIRASGYVVLSEVAYQLFKKGVRFIERPAHFVNRNRGISNFSLKEIREAFTSILKVRFGSAEVVIKKIAIIILFAAAVFLSVFKLTQSPPIWTDEGIFIQAAMNLADSGKMALQTAPGVILPSVTITCGYPALYPISLVFKYFGAGILQARIVAIIFLLLAVWFFYRLAKNSFVPKVALWALALLVTFPPLYGIGKNVLGEVPGMFFLLAFLFFVNQIERGGGSRKDRNFIFAGLAAGFCIATKPTFLVLLPAAAAAYLFFAGKIKINFKETSLLFLAFLSPIALWLKFQFGPGDFLSGVLGFYVFPHALGDVRQTIVTNFLRFFREWSPAYFFAVFICWLSAFSIKFFRKEKKASLAETAAIFFSGLIFLAYLRTPGWYKNFFPAMMLALLYFPASIYAIFEFVSGHTCFFKKSLAKFFAAAVIFLLVAVNAYKLIFSSWVADNYQSSATQALADYFSGHHYENVFVYNAPETVIFLRTKDYYQFLEPTNYIKIGEDQLDYLSGGKADFVVIGESFYNRDRRYFNLYKVKDTVDRFLILEKIINK